MSVNNLNKSGRGAGYNSINPFHKNRIVTEFPEGLDEPLEETSRISKVHIEYPKNVVNRVDSPDLSLVYSINPYQGCEHGCIYCYARNSHTYWGFSAGLDFEQQIMAKPNAPELLRKFLSRKNYVPESISIAGNTDCYQPLEKKMRITRQLLEVLLEFRHPVGLITKNSLILRDLDILKPLAEMNLVSVFISITTLDEKLRRNLEPRTSTALNKLKTVQTLADNGIPVGVMMAPIIPGLTVSEIPAVLEASANAGASAASYTMLRLNGQVAELFSDWVETHYPGKKDKILNQVKDVHDGKLNDSQFGRRMKGEGPLSDMVKQLFNQHRNRLFEGREMPDPDYSLFRPTMDNKGQRKLF